MFKLMYKKHDLSQLSSHFSNISVHDEIGNRADTLQLSIIDERAFPMKQFAIDDKLQLLIQEDDKKYYEYGYWYVNLVRLSYPLPRLTLSAVPFKATTGSSMQNFATKNYSETSIYDIVNKIATKLSLEAKISSKFKSIKIANIGQTRESYSNFLYNLATTWGAVFKITDNSLIFKVKQADNSSVIELKDGQILDFSLINSKRKAYKSVLASYWDVGKGKEVEVIAGKGEPHFEINYRLKDKATALSKAQVTLNEIKTGGLTLNIETLLKPSLRAGSLVKYLGKNWSIKQANHVISNTNSNKSHFECEELF